MSQTTILIISLSLSLSQDNDEKIYDTIFETAQMNIIIVSTTKLLTRQKIATKSSTLLFYYDSTAIM